MSVGRKIIPKLLIHLFDNSINSKNSDKFGVFLTNVRVSISVHCIAFNININQAKNRKKEDEAESI